MSRLTLLAMVLVSTFSSGLTLVGATLLLPRTAEAQSGALYGSSLTLVDRNGQTRIYAGTTTFQGAPTSAGSYLVALYDAAGTEKGRIVVPPSGAASMGLDNPDGSYVTVLLDGGESDGRGSVYLSGPNGPRLLSAP